MPYHIHNGAHSYDICVDGSAAITRPDVMISPLGDADCIAEGIALLARTASHFDGGLDEARAILHECLEAQETSRVIFDAFYR